jgi:hypothetical protein
VFNILLYTLTMYTHSQIIILRTAMILIFFQTLNLHLSYNTQIFIYFFKYDKILTRLTIYFKRNNVLQEDADDLQNFMSYLL